MEPRAEVVVLSRGALEDLVEDVVRRTVQSLREDPDSDWMSADDASRLLGVPRKYLADFVRRNDVPCYRPGPKIMTFRRSELLAFLEARAGR